ncbi:MAG: hypothetical protein ACFFBD_11895 [Candidatus Hodarchaeota archaeon]
MATEASLQALSHLRDLTMVKWYIIPLFAIVLYIYAIEIKKAQKTDNWNTVFAGLALFGMDLINEVWNSLIFHFTQHSAFWTTPGDTAFLIMIGWNIEIAFMFSIAGIVFANFLPEDKNAKIDLRYIKIPNRWFHAVFFSAFCVFVEVLLNAGGALVWEYPFWNANIIGIIPIFFLGYFHFFVVAFWVHDMEKIENKLKTIGVIYGIGVTAVIIFMGILGWI